MTGEQGTDNIVAWDTGVLFLKGNTDFLGLALCMS